MSAAFDPARAARPCRVVPVGSVVDLLSVTHAPERVAAYREAMAGGAGFPPIGVVRLGRRFVIADGHKRFAAYRALGRADILVEVWPVRAVLADLLRQTARFWSRAGRALAGLLRGGEGRRQAAAFVRGTVAHWVRTARSLAALRRR